MWLYYKISREHRFCLVSMNTTFHRYFPTNTHKHALTLWLVTVSCHLCVCILSRTYYENVAKNRQQKRKLKPVLSRLLLGLKKLECQISSVLFQNSILKYTAEYLFF